jgi:hypothetical protein
LMSPRKSSSAGCSERGAWPHAAAASGRIADLDAAGGGGGAGLRLEAISPLHHPR